MINWRDKVIFILLETCKMSDGVSRVSVKDIQLVQNLIERCLQLYMNQREVVSTLLTNAKIEPGFTELVWQKLEAENQEFFRAYHLRLIVKDQISRFNQLLERQVELMSEMCSTGVSSIPLSNGSQIQSMNLAYLAPQPAGPPIKPENMHDTYTAIPNVYTNGASLVQPCMQVGINMAGHGGTIDVSANRLCTQGPNSGMNEGLIKSYAGNSPFVFGADNNLLEHRNTIGEASVSHPFNGGESSSQALNETTRDPEMNNTFGFLGQMPRNFSLSDLTADFSNSTDILESYSGSPFLGTDTNFQDPHFRSEQQDVRRLDTITEGPSYEEFGHD
ncbi:hypothetical protein BUALT_Bualt16G0114000 [Buddleja alternifolia]|uniref:Angiotensin-converting enzyme 2 n=1 Tax=Buddleja alternifolia TaxID=168488 RepID=A0AAV6WG83_9LAMI|nr:hypothetical protein BUALT_Bualt16G0114000 [Buddleja alternifolia]